MVFSIDVTYQLVELRAWSWWKLGRQFLFGQKVSMMSVVDSVHTFVFSFSNLKVQVITSSCVIWISKCSCLFESTRGCRFGLCFWRCGRLLHLTDSCAVFALRLELMTGLLIAFGFCGSTLYLCLLVFFLNSFSFRLFLHFICFILLLLFFDCFPLLKLFIFCFCFFLSLWRFFAVLLRLGFG